MNRSWFTYLERVKNAICGTDESNYVESGAQNVTSNANSFNFLNVAAQPSSCAQTSQAPVIVNNNYHISFSSGDAVQSEALTQFLSSQQKVNQIMNFNSPQSPSTAPSSTSTTPNSHKRSAECVESATCDDMEKAYDCEAAAAHRISTAEFIKKKWLTRADAVDAVEVCFTLFACPIFVVM